MIGLSTGIDTTLEVSQMTITEVTQESQSKETISEHPLSKVGLLPMAGLLFLVAVVWRIVDIFVLGLGDTWINIMPSKLFPLLIIAGVFWKYRRSEFSSVLGLAKGPYFRTQIVLGIGIFAAWHLMLNVFPKILYGAIDSAYTVSFAVLNVEILWYLFHSFNVLSIFFFIIYFPLYYQTNIMLDFKTFKFNFVVLFPIIHFVVF